MKYVKLRCTNFKKIRSWFTRDGLQIPQFTFSSANKNTPQLRILNLCLSPPNGWDRCSADW